MYRKVLRHPLLPAFLKSCAEQGETIHAGWGLKASGRAAIRAARTGGRLLLLEDAFVRSIRPGAATVYGVLADSGGIHYAADGNSDLVTALRGGEPVGWMRRQPLETEPVAVLMERFRELRISKYNWFPGEFRETNDEWAPGILVVDQTRGDASIRAGGMEPGTFDRMLRAAFEECEGAPVYLRAHPDHIHRAKHSCFSSALLADKRLRLLPPDLPPASCFPFCRTVMTGCSLLGMEALIHGCRVTTFGAPFYAGWGLTDDRARNLPPRGRALGVEDLFRTAYLEYCHYFDPDTKEPCGFGRILDHLALQKEMFRRNHGLTVTVGLNPWKKQLVGQYLRSPGNELVHVAEVKEAMKETPARLLVWGRKEERPAGMDIPFVRMEDGFIRSRGLGAAFNFPYSCVFDESGIYFDAETPSDLEKILEAGIDDGDRARAEEFLGQLRRVRLTKYNLAGGQVALKNTGGRKVILVPGQVESDASIRFGSPVVRNNTELLKRVREENPDAYLVYKIHPDVVEAVRHGATVSAKHEKWCDQIATGGNVLDWLELCDEVHTMTSTVGFESLIRSVPVITYGMPFYAGWGLTIDRLSCPRRTRKTDLAELVYGCLVHYPRYLNPETGEFTTAEKVIALLDGQALKVRRAWHLKCLVKLKQQWVKARRKYDGI